MVTTTFTITGAWDMMASINRHSKPDRAGRYLRQPGGFRAFIPAPLPPDPPLVMATELIMLLADAQGALGRLDGSTETLPDPDFFVGMFSRQEAMLSSRIEGTQATLIQVLELEIGAPATQSGDAREVVNYVEAMKFGLKRLDTLPVSLRLIREIHNLLMQNVRGAERDPGQFRRTQNWIGPAGTTLEQAGFVPPPPHEMTQALNQLEKFIHDETPMPYLLKVGLVHSQFETIHPFLDGNGRIGRLLITFLLCEGGLLKRPVLYLSRFFERNRREYYERLQTVRDGGDWESWIEFFLRGVREVSNQATATAREIVNLRERHRALVSQRLGRGAHKGLVLLEDLYLHPVVSVNDVARVTNLTFASANELVKNFVGLEILREYTGRPRDRSFAYMPYLTLFD